MPNRNDFSRTHLGRPTNRISRRDFLRQTGLFGIAAPLALLPRRSGAAQPASAPSAGTLNQSCGAGGELKMVLWQPPTTLSPQTTNRAQNFLSAALAIEPLLHILPDGRLVPCLAAEVPSVANGLLSPDLTSVTYRLRPDVLWNDGIPFTARDVAFTWRWLVNTANPTVAAAQYEPINSVVAVDDLTAEIRFKTPQPGWYNLFSTGHHGGIYPEHVLGQGAAAHDQFLRQPIGTGPYVVETLTVGESVTITYIINERYREPTKPFFSRIVIESGGDPIAAARSVFETGNHDVAPDLNLLPADLEEVAKGDRANLLIVPGADVEYIVLNHSDPNREVNGQRSQWQTPHPILSDRDVRRALALAIDRAAIANQVHFGTPNEPPASNILAGLPSFTSTSTTWAYDVEQARRLLDEAGWRLEEGVRRKNGVELALTYVIPEYTGRRQVQALVVRSWEALGIRVEPIEVQPAIFFDDTYGNDRSYTHMFHDVHQYAGGPELPFPLLFMRDWLSHDGENIAQRENLWLKPNESRYHNPAYDALYDAAATETDPDRSGALLIAMNDLLIDDVAVIPLFHPAADKIAIANSLRLENIAPNPFEPLTWNIANWNRISPE